MSNSVFDKVSKWINDVKAKFKDVTKIDVANFVSDVIGASKTREDTRQTYDDVSVTVKVAVAGTVVGASIGMLYQKSDQIATDALIKKTQELIANGEFTAPNMTKTWQTMGDLKVRDIHAMRDGSTIAWEKEWKGFNGSTGFAPRMFGEPKEDANCRCMITTNYDTK